MMVHLSVNLNKVALIRNARGGNVPDLLQVATDCERFGAQGITVHPRPDGRHVTFEDVHELKKIVRTELNVEGNPTEDFMKMVLEVKPHQVTLVPDAPEALTSNAGWNTDENEQFLTTVIGKLNAAGIRTSLFMDTNTALYASAKRTGANRIELYTEAYAAGYAIDKAAAVKAYVEAAKVGIQLGFGINAGHDLNTENLRYFAQQVEGLLEVSIGHALISEALYLGLENTIQRYIYQLI
jgi:pyridoxine 5-phosphate synthase